MIASSEIELLSLNEVANQLKVRKGTVRDWIVNGCRSALGREVRLQAVRVGARWRLTQDSVDEFLRKLSDHIEPEGKRPGKRKQSTQAKKDSEAFRKALKERD